MTTPSRTIAAATAAPETSVQGILREAIRSRPNAAAGAGVAVEALGLAVTQALRTVASEVCALRRELVELKVRVDDLAEAKAIPYAGTWKSGQSYAAGTWITHDGSVWIAAENTAARPGDGPTPWRLAVKRGKDGKDVRG
ncbi:hypothetical protein [Inquilinus sp. CA228]|uniref:hypothetical protein n=1 Tax=Inquilinus sp. CA228 TaxID=3455609 RepID=UPI003F8D2469